MSELSQYNLLSYLSELTIPQLKELRLAITGQAEGTARQKIDAVNELIKDVNEEKLEKAIDKLECLSAYKHCWLLRSQSTLTGLINIRTLKSWFDIIKSINMKNLRSFDRESNDLQPTVTFLDEHSHCIFIKFTQWVRSDNYEQVNNTTRELKVSYIRHPVIIVIDGKLGVFRIHFNGFKQGVSTPINDRVQYGGIVYKVKKFIESTLSLQLEGVPLAKSIECLLDDCDAEVKDIRRHLHDGVGNMAINTDEDASIDTATYLQRVLKLKLGSEIPLIELRDALKETTSDVIVLQWKNTGLLAKISFHDIAPEILFIWRASAKSPELIQNILSSLLKSSWGSLESTQPVFEYINNLGPDEVFKPTDLSSKFGLSIDEVYGIVFKAISNGQVKQRFRIKTKNILHDITNEWRDDLSSLPDSVEDDDSKIIDLTDPKNIEVGFSKVQK